MVLFGIIGILLATLFVGSIKSNLRDAFQGEWMLFDDPEEPKVEMENSEYDYGHNVKHKSNDE